MSPLTELIGGAKVYGWGNLLAAGAFESIASATGTGSSGTITFSSIPSTYQHLQIRINLISSAANDWIIINNINADTGNNYAYHNLAGNGSSVLAEGNFTQNKIIMYNTNQYVSSAQPFSAVIDIHNYTSSTQNKTVRFFSGQDANGSGCVTIGSGLWVNTNAINSLKIESALGGNFSTSSTFALYGIKGA